MIEINADDLPVAKKMLDRLKQSESLVSLVEERDRLIREKKAHVKRYSDAIKAIEEALLREATDIKNGQGQLFDNPAQGAVDGIKKFLSTSGATMKVTSVS